MISSEIKDRKEIDEILRNGRTTSAVAFWEWSCAHCGCKHQDPQFTKHGKYRECTECRKGNLVVLPY